MESSAVQQLDNLKNFITPFLNLAVPTTVKGYHHIQPKGKLVVVANHRSDMDPFIISLTFPRFITWVAADYTFRIPIFKDLVSKAGCIPMGMDSKVPMASIRMIQNVFKSEGVLGIFPEGHDYMVKNDFSAGMAEFHSGFTAFAIKNKSDIQPAYITSVEEKISDIPIPPIVRGLFGMPEEVCKIKKRVTYKRVIVSYGERVEFAPFADLPFDKAMSEMGEVTRRRMLELADKAKVAQ